MRILSTSLLLLLAWSTSPAHGDVFDDWTVRGDSAFGPPVSIEYEQDPELLRQVAALFLLEGSDLRQVRSRRQGQLRLVEFRQHLDQRPVLDSSVRLVFGAGRLVSAFAQGVTSHDRAWPVQTDFEPDQLLAPFPGAKSRAQRSGWITGRNGSAIPVIEVEADNLPASEGIFGNKGTLTFELPSGVCLQTRSAIVNCDICGSAHGHGTIGLDSLGPDSDSLPLPLANLVLDIDGTVDSIVTDANGLLSWEGPVGATVSLTGTLSGLYVNVLDDDGPELSIETGPVSSGEPIHIELNELLLDADTAEINAYVHVNRAHDWLAGLDLDPPFTALDFPLQVRVNRQSFGNCNAAFDPGVPELFFLPEGGGCPNSAYSSVIYHEYVHAVVFEIMGGFPSLDLNEGLADSGSTLLSGHRLVGRNFYGPGLHLRDLEPDLVFPVVGDIWTRGRVVAGSFFDLRTRLFHELGAEAGQALAELLFAKSLYFMPNSIGDGVVTAVLLADDDNADLSDGTPHDQWILESFQIHGLQDQFMPIDPIRSLTEQSSAGLLTFTWFLTASYDEITVERDGAVIAVLPGSASFFIDDNVTPGLHTYLFRGRSGGVDSPATPILIPIDDYTRGDASADHSLNLDDVFSILDAIIAGTPLDCPDAADVDDNGLVQLGDVIVLLGYLFQDGTPPAAPFPATGSDTTADFLPCAGEL